EIAILGLAGGFLTPLLLSTGSDNPIGLFGYILMLDAGLVVLAIQRRWPILISLGLGGTVLYQMGWILGRMDADRTGLGLAILALFAGFFLFAGRWAAAQDAQSEQERRAWRRTQTAGVLIPFAFALYFAGNADLGPHLYPAAILMAALSAAACWLGRAEGFALLPPGAAAGVVAVTMVWTFSRRLTEALSWEAAAVMIALAAIFHLFFELELRDEIADKARHAARAALLPALGFLLLAAVAPVDSDVAFWPWLLAWAALGAMVYRQGEAPGMGWARLGAAVGVGAGFALLLIVHRRAEGFPSAALFLALAALAAVAFQAAAMRRDDGDDPGMAERAWAERAAALYAGILAFAHVVIAESPAMPTWLFLSSTLLFALLITLTATRIPSGRVYFAAMTLASLAHLAWVGFATAPYSEPNARPLAIAFGLTGVLLFTFWPFLAGRTLIAQRGAVYAAALAGPAWFLALRELYEGWLGDSTIGVVPVVLGALSLSAVLLVKRQSEEGAPALRALVWFAAVALSFLALAIPLQLSKEWITIGWAVQAAAILMLWKRLDHPGLKYFALALLGAVSARLLLNPEVVDYHGRGALPILNWLAYTYLVPAAALLVSAGVLRGLEIARARPAESWLYRFGQPVGAVLCSVAAILVVFGWINLTIFDFFSTGSSLEISFDRMAARDLTLSLAWALYALVLLGVGFKRDSGALRWLSLAFLVLTIGKVFLHDLGELEDLYRVASLVGLALSLILVSLAYQRFVFRKGSS
ncbi:MAG: DUF2339 domain-containing protein, partial [Acidobacteria bacterium]|nr:DUF2339 domain-containing protein [Acidobacteriota bacterium]